MAITRDAALDWMNRFAGEMAEHRAELVALDTAIGDGDHGTNMNRGMKKAVEKLDAAEQADPGAVLKTVAMALVSSVGGAAGPLYGTLFLQMGRALAGQDEVDLETLRGGVAQGPGGSPGSRQGPARRQDDGGRADSGGGGAGIRVAICKPVCARRRRRPRKA